jgi:hypothetical protein
MKTVSVVIDGRPFVVNEALARALHEMLRCLDLHSYGYFAAMVAGVDMDGAPLVRFADDKSGIVASQAVGAALDVLDGAQDEVPPVIGRAI